MPAASNAVSTSPRSPTQTANSRLGRNAAVAALAHQRHNRRGGVSRRGQGGRHAHHQHGVVAGIVEQHLKRGGIARRIRVAGNVHRIGLRPDRRQLFVKSRHRGGRERCKLSAEIDQAVNGQHPNAAAIGQDR